MPPIIRGEFWYGQHLSKSIVPRCYLRVYDLVGDCGDPTKTRVAVFCELPREGYSGLSVTNGAEHIITSLWEQHQLHPERTVYVEHYPEERPARLRKSLARRLSGEETFDVVTVSWARSQACNPTWRAASRGFVEALIGEPFAELSYMKGR